MVFVDKSFMFVMKMLLVIVLIKKVVKVDKGLSKLYIDKVGLIMCV